MRAAELGQKLTVATGMCISSLRQESKINEKSLQRRNEITRIFFLKRVLKEGVSSAVTFLIYTPSDVAF